VIVYQISLHGDAYDARDKDWDQMYAETGCKPRTEWLDPIHRRTLLKGEFGCSVSHYRVWQKIADSGLNGLILEEDVVFSEINPSHADWMLEDHDSVWLGYRWNDMGYWYNCHAYAITPETANLLIEDFHNNIIPVDEWVPQKLRDKRNYFYPAERVTQIPRSTRPSTIEDTDMLPENKMHIVTVATDTSKMWALKQSAYEYSATVVNLGEGSEWYSDMTGMGGMPKIKFVRDFVKTLPADDIVLFMDGYDTFFADHPDEVLARFKDFGVDLLFGAEEDCWPLSHDEFFKQKWTPVDDAPYRYLNSGLFIGKAGAILSFIDLDAPYAKEDDQLYYQQRYLTLAGDNFPYTVGLDYEAYIFQNHDPSISVVNEQLYNDRTNCCGCIYHGNGGDDAKSSFRELAGQFGYHERLASPATVDLKYDEVAQDILVTKLLTPSQCDDLIAASDKFGDWGSLEGDKFPAQEIRLKQLGVLEFYESLWENHLAKICEKHWSPVEYMGIRDAFTMRYAMDTQKSLGLHTDASLITGSVKLNDNYKGATLHFPRQGFSNLDVPVGSCILFPSQVTHGHFVDELTEGTKYSLTMWTSRYKGDVN